MTRFLTTSGLVLLLGTGTALAQPERPSFASLDADNNGSLSPAEVSVLFEQMAARREQMRERLEARNPDGPPEGARRQRLQPDPDMLFSRMDSDGDGAISEAEFNAMPGPGGRGPGGPGGRRGPGGGGTTL